MVVFTTLGLCALAATFKEASMLYVWTNGYLGEKNLKTAKEALAFIQGTGLEIMIKVYDMGFDADSLRNTFFRTFHVKATD